MDAPSRTREMRLRRGLTLDELGAMTGLDRGWLSRAERGFAPISPENRAKIAAALGFPEETLFSDYPAKRGAA